jgi:hypothetical protein
MAGAIDQDNAIIRSQPITEGKSHISKIGTAAMQQDYWRCVGGTKLNEMQSAAFDVDKTSQREMCPFDPIGFKCREYKESTEASSDNRSDDNSIA